MKVDVGDKAIPISLPAIDGQPFTSDSLQGKRYLLSFFRFATCPFCNMRVHELVTRYDELGDGLTIVAIFDSPLDNLQTHASEHHAPFPILADEKNTYYQQYGVQRSLLGTLKGGILRLPYSLYGMFVKGYFPWPIKGAMTTMPLDMLVDEQGVIQVAYYGTDEGDHLAFDQIKQFSLHI